MTLPASGAISLSAVNTELGLSSTAAITMNDSAVRTLFGVASGAITMNNGYGKTRTISFSGFDALASFNGSTTRGEAYAIAVNSSGVMAAVGFVVAYPSSKASYTRSTDGSTWTTPATINGTSTISRMSGIVALPSGKFVAVGYDPVTNNGGGYVATSADGSTWTTPTSIGSCNWNAVCYNPTAGRIVAVGDDGGGGQVSSYSDNQGASWSSPAFQTAAFAIPKAVCWNPVLNMYACVGRGSASKPFWQTSTNGTTWTAPVTITNISGSLNAITVMSSGRFVAVGSTVAAGGGGYGIYGYSDDGATWTTNYTATSTTNADWYGVAINGLNQILAVGYNGQNGLPCWTKSTNGTTWTTLANVGTGSNYGAFTGIATRPDGKFMATGYLTNGGNGYQIYMASN
jgi:hypothetical protein